MKRDGVSYDVSMCPCTNPLILIMGISLLPVARSLFPFNLSVAVRGASRREGSISDVILIPLISQYCSVKARDAINRRLYNNHSFVETAIYRVFGI
ncbi:MAG: hypothetical protein V7K67_10705 [Nostoc sp.]|uniref:hypothetical protein n=1 Tax=Nostoc sp. TaxID=1180 RepID=UPI002FF4ACD0